MAALRIDSKYSLIEPALPLFYHFEPSVFRLRHAMA